MKFFQSKAFKAWAPVLVVILIAVVAALLFGASNRAVAPGEAASTTPEAEAASTTAPAAPATTGSNPSSIGIGGVKSTTYAPNGWTLKFKLEDGWRVQPIRNDDGTVSQVSIGTSVMSMMVLHDKPFGKPARVTPILSTKTILGTSVEIATYDDTSYFTMRHDGDDYNFSVKGGLDAFIASIQAAS